MHKGISRGQQVIFHLLNFVSFVVFSALLNSSAFHVSLMACSLEVVMAEKGLPCMLGFFFFSNAVVLLNI